MRSSLRQLSRHSNRRTASYILTAQQLVYSLRRKTIVTDYERLSRTYLRIQRNKPSKT
jgi:hypothetical protein